MRPRDSIVDAIARSGGPFNPNSQEIQSEINLKSNLNSEL
jgi:hypothetical protein